jgi:hypothetical protein
MGFGAYVETRDVENNLTRIFEELGRLLLAVGQEFQGIDVQRIAAETQTTIVGQILGGVCYACYDIFLKKPFALEARKRAHARLRGRREDLPRGEFEDRDEPDETDGAGPGLPSEAEEGFLRLYQDLRRRLAAEEPMLPMLDRWVATVKGSWVRALAEEEFERGSDKTLEQLTSRFHRLRRLLREHIHDVFEEWFQMWAEARNQPPPRLLPDLTAELVIPLIRRLLSPPLDTPRSEKAENPESGLSLRRPNPDDQRRRWLRGRQRDLMFDRATCCADRPYHALLKAYAAGTHEAEILRQLYGDVTEDARRRRDADLDTLHRWYEEITRAALPTRKAWSFYDSIPKIGPGVVARAAARHPDYAGRFQPILKASKDGVPFTQLPDELGVSWEELTNRVLELKVLVASRDNEAPQPSGWEAKS